MLSSSNLVLLDQAVEIEQRNARDAGSIGYMAREIIQATMPHRDPMTNEFRRKNGTYTLVMMAPAEIGLPFGVLPRLILCWVSTEAVLTKRREVILGDSLTDFMRELGIIPTGGKNGSITHLKSQMKRLFSTSISCIHEGDSQWTTSGFRIADEAHLWWHPRNTDQLNRWHSRMILGDRFFKCLVDRPVPLDMRALKALKRSPLALDIYCWLTYRMSYLRHPTLIPWSGLAAQFGSDYVRPDNFKAAFLHSLRRVLIIYPELQLNPTPQGLLLKPSRTHVLR